MEKISIIIPVYGVEEYLDRCLESVVNQTYENLEIILVNDASPDNCGKMCDDWAKKDSRIKVIHKEVNEGLGFARNSGLEHITGKYVTFVDSDDWIGELHIQNLYNKIIAQDAQTCIGGFTRVFSNGLVKAHKNKLDRELYVNEEVIDNILLPLIAPDVNYLPDIQLEPSSCMTLYAAELIKDNNIRFMSERYVTGEDFFFNIRYFYYAKKVVSSDSAEYYYFENVNSTSNKYRRERFERTINFYHEMKKIIKEQNLENKISYRIERSYIAKVRVAIRLIANSDLKYKDKVVFIKEFLKAKETKDALKVYPINTYSKGLRIVAVLMKYKCVFCLYVLMRIRARIKK